MKVLVVHDKDLAAVGEEACTETAGGLAVHVAWAVEALERAGVDVAVVDVRPGGAAHEAAGARYRVPGFRFRWRPDSAARIERILTNEQPDVIHVHSVPTLHPRLARRMAACAPLVWSLHDAAAFCPRRTLRDRAGEVCARRAGLACATRGCYRIGTLEPPLADLLRVTSLSRTLRAFAAAALLTAPSAFLRSVMLRHGVAAERIALLPLASRFEGANAAPTGAAPALLFAGRMTHDKGTLALVEALGRLRDERWTATLAGDGPARPEVAARVAALGLSERVRLPGTLGADALAGELRRCDVLVLPSLAPESFGLIGVEAMAFGRPVVAFDAGGIADWLVHGETGLLARHGDVGSLAGCMRVLLRDAALRARLGLAARERQRERFGEETHVARLLGLYVRAGARREART